MPDSPIFRSSISEKPSSSCFTASSSDRDASVYVEGEGEQSGIRALYSRSSCWAMA